MLGYGHRKRYVEVARPIMSGTSQMKGQMWYMDSAHPYDVTLNDKQASVATDDEVGARGWLIYGRVVWVQCRSGCLQRLMNWMSADMTE